jgi:hypothetical protein
MPSGSSSARGAGVLLGQDLGGRHERGLVAALDGEQHGEERDDGLAGADVALQQRFIRRGDVMSAKISAIARVCAPVSSNGSAR